MHYMLELIYSHIDHTLWSIFVLVLSSMVLGESFRKANTYMVSKLLENTSAQSHLRPSSCFITAARLWSITKIGSVQQQIWPHHCVQNADSVKIGYTDAYPRPKSIVRQFFLQISTQRPRFALPVWSVIFNFSMILFLSIFLGIFYSLRVCEEKF